MRLSNSFYEWILSFKELLGAASNSEGRGDGQTSPLALEREVRLQGSIAGNDAGVLGWTPTNSLHSTGR